MRAPEVEALLAETRQMLGDHPWGVGILGFVPLELRQEQLAVIRTYRPAFALIAGGRPDQALTLEHAGIPTYLHVPSPGLLKLFVEHGARRFVFEGRECGGHVGPRSSFVLWNTMIDTLLEALPTSDMADCHVLFAGGIHDAISTAMVATLAAPLAERQAKIGVLLGTAYVFTQEAVSTGAILEGFQQEAIHCTQTVLLETGPGHATRCAATSYTGMFEREKQRLSAAGRSVEDIREVLEELNLGRLRIASKGISRLPGNGQDSQTPKFMTLSAEEQRRQGMYMLGQVAALRDSACTIAELHHEVSVKGSEWLVQLVEPAPSRVAACSEERPCDVAIVGMACLFPKASNLQTYWENILNKVDAITEVPKDRWDWQRYFDADPKTPDKIYSKWGGFLDDIPFDPMRYGMPPNSLSSIEPLQLLTLEVVRAALQDAGYLERPFPRQRTAVILGAGGGVAELGNQYAVRSALPMLLEDVAPDVLSRLPEWTEDSFAGILLNVAAGRVANRFDLGGVNYTVDAACASSLAAVYHATRELEAGTSDLVIVGGADTVQNPFGYLAFSKTHALSPHGRCQTFDESADGIVISEGIAILVLKRLADAEREGDRIYGVIKAVAGSSDGRDKGLTAPRPEGQALALERAYAKAGFSPATVGLIEAHGTGTVAGDQAEVETLKRVFGAAGAARQRCAIGSVKSMIGHTKCTAGVAGLLKVALALYHKVLPPTIHVTKPNSKARFHESPFYVNIEPHPWIDGLENHPRRAGVSAFGFGGTNFHAVLEEYTEDFLRPTCPAVLQNWPGELLLWTGNSRQVLLAAVAALEQALALGAGPDLRDLAYTLWQLARERSELTLAVVATSLDDLRQKLSWTQEALRIPEQTSLHDPRGIYFAEEPLARQGKVAFLFPGQGSQYPDMLCELATVFPQVRTCFEHADRILVGRLPERLSSYIFPPPRFSPEEERACQQALTQTNVAQPALGAASMGLFHLLQTLGVRPDLVAGHSYGEYIALCSAAVFGEEVLYTLSEARGRCILEAADQELGTMAAVAEGSERITAVLQSVTGVWIANVNAPRQTVISGTRQGVAQAIERLGQHGIQARPIPVACAFHSPVIAPARDRLATVLSRLQFGVPQVQVFSNASAAPYPDDPPAIASLLAEHLVSPVRFADEVDAMYGAGARIFVEIGPRNVLTSLTKQILGNRAHLAVALDAAGHSGLLQLLHTVGQLAAHGVPLQLEQLYEGRVVRQLNLAALARETRDQPLPPTVWLVNGS
jgi:polyketide-type polyunsaturated fatty acid synthase PfaA